MDYAFEVITESDSTLSVTWDPPIDHEGIGLRPVTMIGSVCPKRYRCGCLGSGGSSRPLGLDDRQARHGRRSPLPPVG